MLLRKQLSRRNESKPGVVKFDTLGFAMERLCCALKGKTLMSSTFDEFVAINTAYPNCRCAMDERERVHWS